MHPELTNAAHGRVGAARAALAAVACLAMFGVTAGYPAGAQDDDTQTTEPTQETVDVGATGGDATEPEGTVPDAGPDATAPADAVADGGASAPAADDEAQSDERLLNLIIIGLLVLAAVIAVATLLFWKSTAPEDEAEASNDEAAKDGASSDDAPDESKPKATPPVGAPADRAPVAPPSAAPAAAAPTSSSAEGTPSPAPDEDAALKPSGPRRRVMASFPSSPLGDAAHVGAEPIRPDPPAAPIGPGDEAGGDISTLGAGASPGRPSVPSPAAVQAAPQRGGAYRVPAPDELPAQPDRPFADAENRPPVERAADRSSGAPRQVPAPDVPPSDSAIVTTSKPIASEGPPSEEGPPVVVRRRRRDRPEGPWGEGVGGGHRPDVPPLPPPDPQDQGYQRGVRVVRPEDSASPEED